MAERWSGAQERVNPEEPAQGVPKVNSRGQGRRETTCEPVEQGLADEAEELVGAPGVGVGQPASWSEVSNPDVDRVGDGVQAGIANANYKHGGQQGRDLHQPDRVHDQTEQSVSVADEDGHFRLATASADRSEEHTSELQSL